MTRTARLDQTRIDRILAKQESVISRAQAVACGMTRSALRYRIRAGGPWRQLLPGVYLTVTGCPTLIQKEIAAALYAGPHGVLTGGWEWTMQRHARMSAHGIVVLHFSPSRIRADSAGVVADIKAALAVGQRRPRLAVRALPGDDRAARRSGGVALAQGGLDPVHDVVGGGARREDLRHAHPL